MANPVDVVIGSEAIKQVQNLVNQLILADAELLKISQTALQAVKNISGISTPKGFNDSLANNSKLSQELDKQNKIINSLSEQIKKLSQVRAINNKMSAEEAVNQRILNQNALTQAKSVSNLVGAYQKLDLQHKKAMKSAQDIGAQYGTNSLKFKKAADEANKLDSQLKNLDSELGKSNRYVGEYERGFNSLGNALGIVGGVTGIVMLTKNIFENAKELQSLDLALKSVTGTAEQFNEQQLFLSSISEKYGLDIKGLTKEFTQFYVSAKDKLSGNEIQQIFEDISRSGSALGLSNDSLSRSFTAVNQMLSKGTVASEELRGQLAESLPGAVQAMTKAVQKLHPELKNLTEKDLFQMIKDGKILANEVLPETARQLALMTGADKAQGMETLAKLTNRLSNSWTNLVDSISKSESGLGSFLSKIGGAFGNILDLTSQLFKNEKQLTDYFQNLGKKQGLEQYNAVMKNISTTTKEQQEITKTALLERERENIRVNQAIIKAEKEKRESITGGDRALFHLQTKAEEDALVQIGKSGQIIKKLNEEKLESKKVVVKEEAKLTKEEIKTEEDRLKAVAELRRKELELDLANIDTKLNNEDIYYTERLGALDEDFLKRVEIAKLDYDEENRLAKGNQEKQKTALINFQLEKIKLLEDYNKKKNQLEALDLNANGVQGGEIKDPLKSVDESAKAVNERLKEFADNADDIKKKIIELKKETDNWLGSFSAEFFQNSGLGSLQTFFDGSFKELLEGSEEDFSLYFNAIAESAQETVNFISSISQQSFDAERNRLQNQYDVALGFANGSKAAEEKLALDLEKRKKEIANRENKAKQKQAIFNIAIDTAQAIMSVFAKTPPPAGIPLALFVGALGAVQIGLVAAQKIPQYAEGTDNHTGGLMLVNDAKGASYQEKIIFPNGKEFMPQGRNVLMDAPAGTKVLTPEQQLMQALNGTNINLSKETINRANGMTAEQMDYVLGKHFGNITTNTTIFDEDGMRTWSEKNGNKTIKTASRVTRTGIRV